MSYRCFNISKVQSRNKLRLLHHSICSSKFHHSMFHRSIYNLQNQRIKILHRSWAMGYHFFSYLKSSVSEQPPLAQSQHLQQHVPSQHLQSTKSKDQNFTSALSNELPLFQYLKSPVSEQTQIAPSQHLQQQVPSQHVPSQHLQSRKKVFCLTHSVQYPTKNEKKIQKFEISKLAIKVDC